MRRKNSNCGVYTPKFAFKLMNFDVFDKTTEILFFIKNAVKPNAIILWGASAISPFGLNTPSRLSAISPFGLNTPSRLRDASSACAQLCCRIDGKASGMASQKR